MSDLIEDLIPTVLDAGVAAMRFYNDDVTVHRKTDNSPVTDADLEVDRLLLQVLEKLHPDIPVVTEERAHTHKYAGQHGRFFLVDPIDGTKEFVKKTDEFTINIALIENGQPVAGVVYAPALGRLFVGDVDRGAFEINKAGERKSIGVRRCEKGSMTAVVSRSHMTPQTEAFISDNAINDNFSTGSSLKFCVIAAGEADIYPRFGPTMEWDTAAGHAVINAAGGSVVLEDGTPLVYGKADCRNPNFIACSPHAKSHCVFKATVQSTSE